MFNAWLIGLGIYCILLVVFGSYYLYKRLKGVVVKYQEELSETKKKKIVSKISMPSIGIRFMVPIISAVIGLVIVATVGSLVFKEVKNSVVNLSGINQGTGLNLATLDGFPSSTMFGVVAIGIIIILAFGLINVFSYR